MPKGNESTATFKANITQLKSAMQEASRQARLANSEFKAATAGLGMWSKSADGLTAKIKQLDTVLGAEQSKLSSLQKQYELTAKEQGANSKGAQELAIELNNQKAVVDETKSKLAYYEGQLDDCKNGTGKFADELQDANKQTGKASEGFTVMKGALASLVADGIKLATQALKDLGREALEAYKEFDAGRDNVIKATGATGEAADKLVKSYGNVAKSVKGDFDSIGSTLGEVNTRFAFTGDKLEDTTKDFVKFADITGTDATEAVKLVSRAMGDAGIKSEEYSSLLDDLALAAQASGIGVDKLTETLTKYGAPMRALGFDTKESIALFSSWEKAGVNTEIAFSGMKKAISNWSKEGKDSREEFKKTLDEIKKTPNIAKATTKAIEVFGAKAGPDLADAIKGGRFEYSDFVDLLKNSKGTVKNTYEETQDGFDKTELAIQNARMELGEFVGQIMNKYQPQIENAVKNVTNYIKKAFTFVTENATELKVIIAGLIGAFTANKIAGFITSIVGAINTIKTMVTALQTATTASEALNAVQMANPWGLIAGLIGGVATALVVMSNSTREATDDMSKNRQVVDELVKSYSDMKKTREESNNSINAEYGHLEELKKEYNSYVDDQGKIKKKYKERADFILNQLAQAMGVEREEIQKNINKNGKLGKSIDELMLKKKAQATLDAQKSNYDEAVKKQIDAQNAYIKAQKDADAIDAKILDTKKKLKEAQDNYNKSFVNTNTGKQATADTKKYKEELQGLQTTLGYLEESQKTQKTTIAEASKAYAGYSATIQNWEKLSEAAASGSSKKVKEALTNIQNNFITSRVGTNEALQQQVTDAQKNYENLKNAVKNGYAGVSQEDVKAAQQLVTKSKAELSKWFANNSEIAKNATKAGLKIPKSIADGIKSGKIDIDTATKQIQGAIDFTNSNAVKKAKDLGIKIPKSLSTEIANGKTSVAEATKTVDTAVKFTNMAKNASGSAKKTVNAIVKQLLAGEISAEDAGKKLKEAGLDGLSGGDKDAEKLGKSKRDNFVKGIESNPEGVKTAGKSLPKNAKKGADTKDETTNSETSGSNFAQGFIRGIGGLLETAWNKGKELAKKALGGLRKGQKEGSPSKLTTQSGIFFGQGYNNGINEMIKTVVKSATSLGVSAVQGLRDAQEEHSPSKLTYKSGVNFTKGYINGIASMQKSLVKTIKNLVGTATKELLKLNNFNFSEVGQNASKLFADTISQKLSYTTDKIAYQNEQKLATFDNKIAKLEAQRDKKLAKLEKGKEAAKGKQNAKAIQKSIQKQIDATKKSYNKQIKETTKFKEAYQKASEKMISEFNTALNTYQTKAQALIDDTINGITETYQARYDALINKQNNLIDKLKQAGTLFDISGAGVITFNDIKQQTQQIKDYANKLQQIKNKVSSDLFDQIASYDMEQGNAFMEHLLSLSDADLKAYSDAYDEKMQVAESLAENLYKNDFKDIAKDYEKAIKDAMKGLPSKLEELGEQTMKGFTNGLTKNTDYMTTAVKTVVKGMVNTFKKELDIHSPSGVTEALGEFTGEGFGNGIKNMVNYVKKAANTLVNASSQSLEGVKSSIDTAKAGIGSSNNGLGVGGTKITNNYNLVQNNNSPKSLSALETYKARQRQLAMVKAATQTV